MCCCVVIKIGYYRYDDDVIDVYKKVIIDYILVYGHDGGTYYSIIFILFE
jgi:hypothetical protein